MVLEAVIQSVAKAAVEVVFCMVFGYFLILWGAEHLAINCGLSVYPHQTFINACYLSAIILGFKAIK